MPTVRALAGYNVATLPRHPSVALRRTARRPRRLRESAAQHTGGAERPAPQRGRRRPLILSRHTRLGSRWTLPENRREIFDGGRGSYRSGPLRRPSESLPAPCQRALGLPLFISSCFHFDAALVPSVALLPLSCRDLCL